MSKKTTYNTTAMTNRRPIRSRGLPVFQRLGKALVSMGIGPNAISLTSIGIALVGAGAMIAASHTGGVAFRCLCLLAAVCVQLRLMANLMDGIVAELGGRSSLAGRLLNEWPDRVSDLLLLIGFGALVIDPAWWWLCVVAGCSAVLTAYCRELGRAIDAPMCFVGPMAKPHRMALLTAAMISFAAWPGACRSTFWGPDQALGLPALILVVINVGCVITSVRRLVFYHRFIAQQARGDNA